MSNYRHKFDGWDLQNLKKQITAQNVLGQPDHFDTHPQIEETPEAQRVEHREQLTDPNTEVDKLKLRQEDLSYRLDDLQKKKLSIEADIRFTVSQLTVIKQKITHLQPTQQPDTQNDIRQQETPF